MKKTIFAIAAMVAMFVTGCDKDLDLPTVEMGQNDIVTDKDLRTMTVSARITDQGSSDVIDYGICYTTGSNDHPTVNDLRVRLNIDDPENMSGLLEDLADGTYYFRAFATNGEGTAYSSIVRCSFVANTYTVTRTLKVIDESSGEDITSHYNSSAWLNQSGGRNATLSFRYGETCTITPNPNASESIYFDRVEWSDGTTELSHVVTSDIQCVVYYTHRDVMAGSYTCSATNVSTGEVETWGGATCSNYTFYNILGREGVNIRFYKNDYGDGGYEVFSSPESFTNSDGVECEIFFGMEGGYPLGEPQLLLIHWNAATQEFHSGPGAYGDSTFRWVIVRAGTYEVLEQSPVYTNLILKKID